MKIFRGGGERMSDINAILSSAKWAEDSYYLKEFVHKFKLPQVAKVGVFLVPGRFGGVMGFFVFSH